MVKGVGIITVTYNPNIDLFAINLKSYISQVEKVVIVDNSDNVEIINSLSTFCNEYKSVTLIQLNSNFGIAYAQNIGIRYLLKIRFDFFVEIDQDSKLDSEYIQSIINSFNFIQSSVDPNVIALGCLAVNCDNGTVYDGYRRNIGFIKVQQTLSSGLLINLKKHCNVGYKDEKLFIDLVDWDWCWKASKLGFSIYIDTSIAILHCMGDKHIQFLNFSFGVPKPFRHYYAFRNSLYLFTKKHPPLKWKFLVMPLLMSKFLLYPIIMDSGLIRLKFMKDGIHDFIFGKMGKNNA